MRSLVSRLCLLGLLLTCCVVAAPSTDFIEQLLQIADADQVQAYHQMQLTPAQKVSLQALATSYRPKVREWHEEPARLLALIPEALKRADKILTPEQRPLLRTLLPRRHQWESLRDLYLARNP